MAAVNILPESLHPALTRAGFGGEARHEVDKWTPEDFVTTEHGLWLPPFDWSDTELAIAKYIVAEHAKNFARFKDLSQLVGSLILVDKLGCWAPNEKISDEEHLRLLRELAENERMQVILDTDDEFPQMKLCDTESCMCTRHYDFTYGTDSQRREKPQLNPEYYTELQNGKIQTAWLDELPSLRESAGKLYDLQHKCVPYVPRKESVLSASSISKITFNIVTGCWEVRSYYNRPRGSNNKTMYDGYGRLTLPAHIDQDGVNHKSMQIMGHRVIWWVMNGPLVKGQDINHYCSNRPCGFVGHTEEESHASNVRHGARVKRAKRSVDQGLIIKTTNGFEVA